MVAICDDALELMIQLPEPLQVLLVEKALNHAQVEVLLQLERLYPQNLSDKDWTAPSDTHPPSVVELLTAWRDKRPESHPPAPIWKYTPALVLACPRFSTLLASYQALYYEAVTQDYQVPQWITASWWWGCAAVVCQTSAIALQQAIADWAKRYQCALLYLQSNELQRDPAVLAAYQTDLRYSHSETLPQQIDLSWAIRDGFPWGEWYLPSEMQPWGRPTHQTRRLMTSDQERRRQPQPA